MIFYKLSKTFLDRLFELKDKELKHLHVFLISDNKLEQASEWKKITEYSDQIKLIFEEIEVQTPGKTHWLMPTVRDLFYAVGHFGKEEFIKALEIYGVGVEECG